MADRKFAAVHVGSFIRSDGTTHMGAHVGNARNGAKFSTDHGCQSAHGRMRRTGTGRETNDQIRFLERGKQRILAQERRRCDAQHEERAYSGQRTNRRIRRPSEERSVQASQHHERQRLIRRQRAVAQEQQGKRRGDREGHATSTRRSKEGTQRQAAGRSSPPRPRGR